MIFAKRPLLGSGLVAGVIVSLLMAKLIANQIYGVSRPRPISFVVVSILLRHFTPGVRDRRPPRLERRSVVALRSELTDQAAEIERHGTGRAAVFINRYRGNRVSIATPVLSKK